MRTSFNPPWKLLCICESGITIDCMRGRVTINAFLEAIALEKSVADASCHCLDKSALLSQMNCFMNCSDLSFSKIID